MSRGLAPSFSCAHSCARSCICEYRTTTQSVKHFSDIDDVGLLQTSSLSSERIQNHPKTQRFCAKALVPSHAAIESAGRFGSALRRDCDFDANVWECFDRDGLADGVAITLSVAVQTRRAKTSTTCSGTRPDAGWWRDVQRLRDVRVSERTSPAISTSLLASMYRRSLPSDTARKGAARSVQGFSLIRRSSATVAGVNWSNTARENSNNAR